VCIPRNGFTTGLKNIRVSMWKEKWDDARINMFLRLDGGQNISCLQRLIKQKMLQSPNNPFFRYAICKNKNGFTELLAGEPSSNLQLWELSCLSHIPELTVPQFIPKWAIGKTLMVKGPSPQAVSGTPLEFRRQSSYV
jgi:hypothetical protein